MKFLGYGSAFNTKLGNTSAYIKKGRDLVLIDCGCTVFHKIISDNILDKVENINIIITHTHPDHAGSLGDIIFYAYYIMKTKVTIYFPHEEHIKKYFSCIGVTSEICNLVCKEQIEIKGDDIGGVKVEFLKANHVDILPSYSFILKSDDENFYYSGDTSELPSNIIDKLKSGEIDNIYHETSGLDIPGFTHMYIGRLCEKIPMEYRDKVYCMHIDNSISKEKICKEGFRFASDLI